jgi:hypothetical protein
MSNQLLTKLAYLEVGIRGACAGLRASRNHRHAAMAFDPEELVTLTDHGTMKLRSAVSRAMLLRPKERKRAKIVRQFEPAILNFEQIRALAAQWDERLVPID